MAFLVGELWLLGEPFAAIAVGGWTDGKSISPRFGVEQLGCNGGVWHLCDVGGGYVEWFAVLFVGGDECGGEESFE